MSTVREIGLPGESMSRYRQGSTHTEYVLIAAVISVVVVVSVTNIGITLTETLTFIGEILAGS